MKPLFEDKSSTAVDPEPAFSPSPSHAAALIPVPQQPIVPAQAAARPLADLGRLMSIDEIDQLGVAQGMRIAAISQQILVSIRASDADQSDDKLNERIVVAKGLDPRAEYRAQPRQSA